jgi:PAS domain S-box-containing protein
MRFFRTLSGRVLFLTILGLAPLVGLKLVELIDMRQRFASAATERANVLSRAIALQHRSMIEAAAIALAQISKTSQINSDKVEDCVARIQEIRASTKLFTNLARGYADGSVDCSGFAEQKRFIAPAMAAVARALNTGSFAVATAGISTYHGRPVIPVAVPLSPDASGVPRVLVAGVSLVWFDNVVRDLTLDSATIVLAVDQNDIILASHPAKPGLIGTRLASSIDASEPFTVLADAKTRLVASSEFDSGIRVAVGIDESAVLADAERAMTWRAILLIALVAGSIILIGVTTYFWFIKRNAQMVEGAKLIERGDFSHRFSPEPFDTVEIEHLVNSFNAMMDAIEERDRALERSKTGLLKAQSIAHMGSFEWRIEEDRQTWSDELWRISGRSPSEEPPTKEAFISLVYPDDRRRVAMALEAARGEKREMELDFRILRPPGEVRHLFVQGAVEPDESGKLKMIGIAVDITERRQAEANLRTLSLIVEQSPEMVVVTDAKGFVTYVNPSFCRTTGFSADDVIGRPPAVFMAKSQNAEHEVKMWEALQTGREWLDETENRRKDGSAYWVQIIVSPVKDQNGVITHYVSMQRDVTERKLAEMELKRAKEQAEIANRAKSELLANMSHELRTPLNAIIGFSELLSGGHIGAMASDRHREYVGDILDSGKHLLSLINDVLDVSAIEAGMIELHREAVSPTEAIESVRRLVAGRAEKGEIELIIDASPELPTIHVDARRFKQILINLLSNSIKFTPAGGKVTVHAFVGDTGVFTLKVVDTGIGMSDDEIAVALTPFGQVDSSLSRRQEGTGLGLPLTLGLVELHGGKLEISSMKGAGTEITVKIPVA